MIAAERYLKTQSVARALGVSASTIKRWVDSGTIRAVRTVGKHRLIPLSEALRVAREHGYDVADREAEAGPVAISVEKIDEHLCDRLFVLLREGKARQAKALIRAAYAAGCGASVLADQLIRPVMERVGHGWMVGSLDVFQEHEATQTVESSLRELIDRETDDRDGKKPLAIGGATEGDPYLLSTLLGELVLREVGWEVRNLGPNLPLRSLANATRLHKPELVFLSVNFLKDEEAFVREYHSFQKVAAANQTAVIVGGRALSAQLRSELIYASFGDRMAHLAEFATRLLNRSTPCSPDSTEAKASQSN